MSLAMLLNQKINVATLLCDKAEGKFYMKTTLLLHESIEEGTKKGKQNKPTLKKTNYYSYFLVIQMET